MINTQQLKEVVHQFIDRNTDIEFLQELHELVQNRISSEDHDIIDDLSPSQLAQLDQAIKDADAGKTISHEEAMRRLRN